jgi:dihydroorotate dehydrogenase
MYKSVIRPVLFKFDPERVHNATVKTCQYLSDSWLGGKIGSLYQFDDDILRSTYLGIDFKNPVGLAAGFDKNGVLVGFMPYLGFGYMEIGSVTAEACEGTPSKPRLFRLPKDKAIINRMGLNNEGADVVYERMKKRSSERKNAIPVGINIAKTNDPEIMGEKAIEDFCYSLKRLYPVADYITLNISCPNTEDGRTFEDKDALDDLLSGIEETEETFQYRRPKFVKISPDVTYPVLDGILEVSERHGIDGYVKGNTSNARDDLATSAEELAGIGDGGMSGPPVRKRSTELIDYIYRRLDNPFIIGVGGIHSGAGAYEKILAGASIVQILTGLIYEGSGLPKNINRDLSELLRRDGFSSISEAVGSG